MGLGPRFKRSPGFNVSRRIPFASDAIDDTENSDRSVVTDSCDGDRSIRQEADSEVGGCEAASAITVSSAAVVVMAPIMQSARHSKPTQTLKNTSIAVKGEKRTRVAVRGNLVTSRGCVNRDVAIRTLRAV